MLFGDRKNKDILSDFLASILEIPFDEFEEITIINPELEKQYKNDKLGVVDLRVLTKNDETIHIEVQLAPMKEMAERMVYYNSKLLVNQIKEGDDYSKLNKVISVLLVDYIMYDDEDCHSCFGWYDKKTGKLFSDIVEINVIELKKLEYLKQGNKYNWIKFLNTKNKEEFDMLAQKNPILKEAVARLAILSEDEKNRMIAENREKAIRDNNARMRYSEEKGYNEGISERNQQIVLKLIKKNADNDYISEITDLSVEEIEKIRNLI